jgi:hypothetical protein
MSWAPHLIQDTEQNQHQTCPNKNDCLLTIVSDYGHIVLNICIAIEKLVSPPEDAESYCGKAEDGERDRNPRRAGTPACSIAAIIRALFVVI